MITVQQIYELLHGIKPATRNNLRATCPLCGKEEHFYIHKFTGFWDCKKCKRDGSIVALLKALNKLYLLKNEVQVDFNKKLALTKEEEEIDLTLPDMKLPIGFKPVTFGSQHAVAIYLKSRKFTPYDFKLYGAGYTNLKSKLKDYAIIPVTRDFAVKGYVARYIGEEEEPERYLNSTGGMFTKLLMGLDEITGATHTAIMSEGAFDKVSITTELNLHEQDEIKALASFGKKLSQQQILLLAKTNIRNLIFMYDSYDAVDEMKKFGAAALSRFNVDVCFDKTDKDPGKMCQMEMLKLLHTRESVQKFYFSKVQSGKLKY